MRRTDLSQPAFSVRSIHQNGLSSLLLPPPTARDVTIFPRPSPSERDIIVTLVLESNGLESDESALVRSLWTMRKEIEAGLSSGSLTREERETRERSMLDIFDEYKARKIAESQRTASQPSVT